ncbi:MAG: bifunctional folylpolyglutamate synthase/dihydrofolate synthase [Chroococcus sp. CMT-3BRIN-NPC107]|nr:bifunctional folylpolyglutamate synthase/dihydrofolate synthase [Chroococcus sp. CMT-3BRIN-NPC107]
MNVDSILQPFQRFGVHLGLARIKQLLARLGNPQEQVPIIHVAGTNGKGSVCAYLSSILTQAGYKVGRYTSPHLVDWMERICLNEQPISLEALQSLLLQVINAINPATETPTQFEVITAAAWLYFAQSQVDIAIVEVGLGGRLDATNVCLHPLVSVITSISREHWQQLGSTLAEIATEKAGIIKPGCPVVVGQLPIEAENVVRSRITELNCPAVWVEPATELLINGPRWATYKNIEYPLPLLGDIQLSNSALALTAIQILQQNGWKITTEAIARGMAKTRWLGRLQWVKYGDFSLLIDGAHNPAAARALRHYADTLESPITWVMGILSTKDHKEIFTALLRPKDRLHLVPVPDHSSADPIDLAILAQNICPNLASCQTYNDLFLALNAAKSDRLIILCGSLYLVGHFLNNFPAS